MKTHTTWDYKPLDGRGYIWTAPTGHQYQVTPPPTRPPTRPKNLTPHTPAHPGRGRRRAHWDGGEALTATGCGEQPQATGSAPWR